MTQGQADEATGSAMKVEAMGDGRWAQVTQVMYEPQGIVPTLTEKGRSFM